jgi:uncharacterized protein YdcH (DUF465 family)
MTDFTDDLFSQLLKSLEELQTAVNELEKECQLFSNANIEKIKTIALKLQTFFNLYKKQTKNSV